MSAEQVRQLLSTLQHLRSTASKYLLDVSPPDPTAAELQSATQALTAALGNIHGPKLPDIMQEQADALWQGGCKLWDLCVQANNRGLCKQQSPAAPAVALLRQLVCQATALLADEQLTEEEHIFRLRFCLTAGRAWAAQQRWEAAELVLQLASAHAGVFQDLIAAPNEEVAPQQRSEYITLLFDAHLQRLQVNWELGQQDLSSRLLATCCDLAEAMQQQDPGALHLHLQLAAALHGRSSKALEGDLEEGEVIQVLGLLEEAFKLVVEVEASAKATKAPGASSAAIAAPSHHLLSNATELHAKVLLTLAYCHLVHTGKVEDGLRCIAALRQMDTSTGEGGGASAASAGATAAAAALAGHPSVSLLALKAYVALQDWDHAEAEVTGLAVHDEADPTTCLAALLELVNAQLPLERLKPVAELVQGRFPEDPQLLATLVTTLLTTTTTTGTTTTSNAPTGHLPTATGTTTPTHGPWAYEQLALQLLERCEAAGAALRGAAGPKQQVAAALYAAGVGHFKGKRFQLAVQLLVASSTYTEHPAPTCRVLALCQLALQDLTQALEYADLAEKHLPLQAATSFIRLKAHLLRRDTPAANAEMQALCRCQDFDVDLLKVAAQESVCAGALATAKVALLSLHTLLVKEADSSSSVSAAPFPAEEQGNNNPGSAKPGSSPSDKTPEVRVLRALVKLVNDELEAAAEALGDAAVDAAATSGDSTHQAASTATASGKAVSEALTELGRLLTTVVSRVRVMGVLRFTGASQEQEAQQELTYFATTAFNAGLTAADAQDYQACTVLMNHCGNLLHHLSPAKSTELLNQARLAFLLAGSAALEVHKKMPEHAGSLGLAHKMFSSSSAVRGELEEAQMGRQSPGAARVHVFQCLQETVLALRSKDTAAAAAAVEQLQAAAGCTAEHLMKLCSACQQPETRDPKLAARCAHLALQQLLSSAAPDVDQVAATLRLLLTLTNRDEDKLAQLAEVSQVLLGLPSATAYPGPEAAWLVASTWNKGLAHQRFGRHSLATQFMEAALQLLPLARDSFEDKVEAMAAELQRQQALVQGQLGTGIVEVQ